MLFSSFFSFSSLEVFFFFAEIRLKTPAVKKLKLRNNSWNPLNTEFQPPTSNTIVIVVAIVVVIVIIVIVIEVVVLIVVLVVVVVIAAFV